MTRTDTQTLTRRGLALAWFIVVWDLIEGAVAVTAGLAAGSVALVGFGIDSAIEVFAASVVIWQLRAGGRARQRPALRAIAVTFYALAAYVAFESIRDLIAQDQAGESLIGIVLNVVALAVMVPVALAQRRTGRALHNPVLVAQSTETWMSNALSLTVLAGLGLNAALGWWWADPVAALVVAALAAHSGRDAWREAGENRPDSLSAGPQRSHPALISARRGHHQSHHVHPAWLTTDRATACPLRLQNPNPTGLHTNLKKTFERQA